jgi:methenyltetrahydrofolate cyclohydrolase
MPDARIEHLTLAGLLDAIAAKTPAPGGGAVAPIVAALGAALARMVLRYSQGRKALAEHDALHADSLAALDALSSRLLDLAADDAAAYGRLSALMKLAEDDPQRIAQWSDAVDAAVAAPRAVLNECVSALGVFAQLPGRTSRMLASDLAIAAVLAEAAARSAAWNIRINLPLLTDGAAALEREAADAVDRAGSLCARIEQACAPS